MLDVHIMVMSYTPKHVVERCLSSVRTAAKKAPFPVHIHELQGEFGHLGAQRKRGYSQGEAPYVTSVDDDDWIEPNAFAALPLQRGPFAVTTSERVHTGKHWRVSHKPHHLAVYRREWLQAQPYDRLRFFPDQFLLAQAQRAGEVVHIARPVYHHVINQVSGSRRQRGEADKAEIDAERRMVADPELLHWETSSPAQIADAIDRELGE